MPNAVTRASAHLPGVDIEVAHRPSPSGDWERASINLRTTLSFDLTPWAQATSLMWMPWLLTAQAFTPPWLV
jgi:hypothetical protein